MRKIVTILLALLCSAGAMAQNIAIGERMPKIKYRNLLEGAEAQDADFTYIGFVHSASAPCIESLEELAKIAGETGAFRITIFTKERASAQTAGALGRYADGKISEVHTSAGEVFERFGVNYAPFGIIIDSRRRALWFGNPKMLDRNKVIEIIEKHTTICRSQK